MKVLVADDDRVTRHLLERTLSRWGFSVTSVRDGAEAWSILRTDSTVDLLITDWEMPRLDGVALCRQVRAAPRPRYLPIILLTSRAQMRDMVEGLNAGADAFVTKPLSPPELQAQIRVASRILELEQRLSTQLLDLKRAHSRLEADLDAAASVQRSLLPGVASAPPGAEFAWVYDACQQVGGDMLNVFRLDERHVGVYVLDVSGHGVPAALLSVSLSRSLTPLWHHGGMLKRQGTRSSYELVRPAEVAAELNRRFPLMEQTGQFFTFLYGILDTQDRTFDYVRAGHPALVHVHEDVAMADDREAGLPVGILEDAEYSEERLDLGPGDQIILYTDGVNEAVNPGGEEFGTERILDTLAAHRASGIEGNIQELRGTLESFRKGCAQTDDVTIVGLGLK